MVVIMPEVGSDTVVRISRVVVVVGSVFLVVLAEVVVEVESISAGGVMAGVVVLELSRYDVVGMGASYWLDAFWQETSVVAVLPANRATAKA
jgi:hypothetical protein